MTPSLLGQVVLFGDSTPEKQVVFLAVLLYTALHFLVFALLGMGLVALVHWGIENPIVRYALLPLFLVFEVMFYVLIEVLSERTQELFPFWAVVGANTLAAVAMGVYLWRRHPAFRTLHSGDPARRRAARLSGPAREPSVRARLPAPRLLRPPLL